MIHPQTPKHKIPICIGIYGPRLAGKDTAAHHIENILDLTKISLADPIKDEYSKLLGLSLACLYKQGSTKEKHRIGLITLGMLRREEDINWWCKLLHSRVHYDKGIVIPDIRFKNEVEYFVKHSEIFILLKINASLETRKKHGWSRSIADSTATEIDHLQFEPNTSYTIHNNKGIINLHNDLDTMIDKLCLGNVIDCVIN